MAKIDLTRKSTEEQLRIINDYLERRKQHKEQGAIKLTQLIKRFKHKRYTSDKQKFFYFKKLLNAPNKDIKLD